MRKTSALPRPAALHRAAHLALLLGASLLAGTAALAEPVSAAEAQRRLQEGSQAWDLRAEAPTLLPGAVRLALDPQVDAQTLARAVSAAGLDLSRDVLIYGEPGDARAQALHQRLARIASGRVDWLVGGVAEWQMAGHGTASAPARRLPVPQNLVEAGEVAAQPRMAAAALRDPAAQVEQPLLAAR